MTDHIVSRKEKDGTTTVVCRCTCGSEETITAPTPEFLAWERGGLIQRVMPSVPEDLRERLITGTCDKCWDEIFEELEKGAL